MRQVLQGFALGFVLGALILGGMYTYSHAATPTPAQCGTQVSGMPNVLQFTDNNCLAVPPGPTTGTCWIEVTNSVPTFMCHDGTRVKITTEAYP